MKAYYRLYCDASSVTERLDSLEQAQARAEELAAKHPGSAFEILRCVGIAQTSKASTFWMDGEGPSQQCQSDDSPRYRMLKIGDVIQIGDEWEREPGKWVPRNYVGQQSTGMQPTRRPL